MLKPDLTREQTAVIRFMLARSLYKSGRSKEAKEIDRSLLSLPADIQDEFQIPLGLYAAERLAKSNSEHAAILRSPRSRLLLLESVWSRERSFTGWIYFLNWQNLQIPRFGMGLSECRRRLWIY